MDRPVSHDRCVQLTFPTDRVVGTLDWATRDHVRGPALATGTVDVPQDAEISLDVENVLDVQPHGNGWQLHADTQPVDLSFLVDLPSGAISDLSLHRVVAGSMSCLVHLAPGLRRLYLAWSALGDDALPHIAQLTRLIYLQTFGNRFTDGGVQQLANLQELQDLYLEEETLTSAAFAFASQLPRLRRLGLQDVPINPHDLSRLQHRMPRVDVG